MSPPAFSAGKNRCSLSSKILFLTLAAGFENPRDIISNMLLYTVLRKNQMKKSLLFFKNLKRKTCLEKKKNYDTAILKTFSRETIPFKSQSTLTLPLTPTLIMTPAPSPPGGGVNSVGSGVTSLGNPPCGYYVTLRHCARDFSTSLPQPTVFGGFYCEDVCNIDTVKSRFIVTCYYQCILVQLCALTVQTTKTFLS